MAEASETSCVGHGAFMFSPIPEFDVRWGYDHIVEPGKMPSAIICSAGLHGLLRYLEIAGRADAVVKAGAVMEWRTAAAVCTVENTKRKTSKSKLCGIEICGSDQRVFDGKEKRYLWSGGRPNG